MFVFQNGRYYTPLVKLSNRPREVLEEQGIIPIAYYYNRAYRGLYHSSTECGGRENVTASSRRLPAP